MAQEKTQRQGGGDDGDGGDDTTAAGQERREKLGEDVDTILDEIDDVLEENAEDFVPAYVPKGGPEPPRGPDEPYHGPRRTPHFHTAPVARSDRAAGAAVTTPTRPDPTPTTPGAPHRWSPRRSY